jgi:outer membrane protein assembly factor BamB
MIVPLLVFFLVAPAAAIAEEAWLQLKYDGRHSGDVPDRSVTVPLGLIGAVPLTDAVFTAPVIADGHVYVLDGAGVAFCLDAGTLRVVWKLETRGGNANCNNVSSPAIAGRYLHFGTMAGSYYVLDRETGKVVNEIRCGEPILSTPVVGEDRVYFATLGSRIHAVRPDGAVCWTWDFVRQQLGFAGDRWSGKDWGEHKGERVTYDQQFCCSRDLALHGKTLIVPAGPSVVWLEDSGDRPQLRAAYRWRKNASFRITTLGLSVDQTGTVYRQTHKIDNGGEVERLELRHGDVQADSVPGTETAANLPGSLSFSSVSVRGSDVYRCRPEEGFGFCRHSPGREPVRYPGYPSIASPLLLRDQAVYGGLDGNLYVVPLSGGGNVWSFKTAFGKAISAPAAVCDGRVFFGCEDGYLYVLGPGGNTPLPSKDLGLTKIRSPLTTRFADPEYDWPTSFGDWGNTNVNDQALEPPFKIKWIRRYEGTVKHFSTCGEGRLYTHTAEGQIFAVEQDTGRLLWRQYFPGVHISYTTPLYHKGRLLVPQAGLEKCRLRCLDAATGKLVWEAPFSGSPSWNRQQPPVVYKDLAIYMFSSGQYAADRTGEKMQWLFGHGARSFPQSQRALVRAYSLETGKEVWTRDFSEHGYGGDDGGLCLMGDTLYYSCYFGGSAKRVADGSAGVTAAIEPLTGRVLWLTTKHSVHSGCTISGKDNRLYLGGYAPPHQQRHRHVWCLDARDGSLIWESGPLVQAIHVVTVGPEFLFACGQSQDGYLIDKATGKILTTLPKLYRCTRYTFSDPYLLGVNMDIFDTSKAALVSSGPAIDPNACVGAIVSNGRIFYTSQGGGLQLSQVYGPEAASFSAPWETAPAQSSGSHSGTLSAASHPWLNVGRP